MEYRKYNSQDISQFHAKYLIYEYAINELEPLRKKSVDQELLKDQKLNLELINLLNGIQYCDTMSETLVSEKVVNQILQESSQISRMLDRLKWNQWPVSIKWLLEAGLVSICLVSFLSLVPMTKVINILDQIDSNGYVVQIDRKKKVELEDAGTPNQELAAFSDEEVKTLDKKNDLKKSNDVSAASTKKIEEKKSEENIAKVDLKPPKEVDQNSAANQAQQIEASSVVEKNQRTSGFIYRGQFNITNVAMIAPKIKEKIDEMGGRKAGEVEIGWLKSPNVYYFHLTIPEAKLAELQAMLKEYSPNQLKKEVHPRVMPDGIIRLLFTLEEKQQNE